MLKEDIKLVFDPSQRPTVQQQLINQADIDNNFHVLINEMKLVQSRVFSPSNKIVAFGTNDHRIHLFDTETGDYIHTLNFNNDEGDNYRNDMNTIAISPDDKIIASGSNHGTILLWKIKPWTTILLHAVELHRKKDA